MLDRWHLLKNLGEVLQKLLAQRLDVLREAAHEATPTGPSSESSVIAPPSAPSARSRKPPRRKPATPRPQRSWQLKMGSVANMPVLW